MYISNLLSDLWMVTGMGSYHGHRSFTAFTHEKSVLWKSTYFDVPARYPPYSEDKFSVLGCVFCCEGCVKCFARNSNTILVIVSLFLTILINKDIIKLTYN